MKHLNKYPIILASSSPRRKQLLEQIDLEFEVIPSEIHEDFSLNLPPSDFVANLYTSGRVPLASSIMNLHTLAPDSAYVYNSMDLYAPSVLGIASGVPLGLYLYLDCPSGIAVSGGPLYPSSGLWLYTSGSATPFEQINLSMRGK